MKRRGSVQGRADAGTGSGPGVERVITVLSHVGVTSHVRVNLSRADAVFAEGASAMGGLA